MSNGLVPCTVRAGAPGVTDDVNKGFVSGAFWRDTTPAPDALYQCVDPAAGAAYWINITAAASGLAAPRLGNVCSVDAVFGNNATASRQGLPFLTVSAALAAAVSGDTVYILPGVYNLAAGLVVPNGVSIRGINHKAVVLQMLNVVADTTLLTMGENSGVENISISLTSAEHHTLKGIVFPGTTAATSVTESCFVTVDNSGASNVGTSNVYGIHSTGTGAVSTVDAIIDGGVTVKSAGLGAKRGILVDTGAAFFSVRNCNVNVSRTGIGAGSYIGLETNFAGSNLFFRLGTVGALPTADISQTAGTLTIGIVSFINHTANSLGFSTVALSGQFDWGDPGAIGTNTYFMYRGTYTAATASEPKTRLSGTACLSNLVVRAVTGPGAARVDTWTIRVNGVDTALVATLTGAQTSAVITGISVTAQAGDDISLKMVTVAGSTTANVQVTCNYV